MSLQHGLSGQESRDTARTLAPLPGRTRTRSITIRIILVILAIWGGAHLLEFARDYRWNQQAPLVVEIRAFSCALSPDGNYLTILADTVQRGEDFFAAESGEHISIPRPAGIAQPAELYGVWLDEDRYLNYHIWEDDATVGYQTKTTLDDIPQDGWLVDVGDRSATTLADLPAAERERVLAFGRQQLRTYEDRVRESRTSPDGRYVFRDGAIYDQSGNQLVSTLLPDIARPCAFGWKHDSSGIYFVDRERPPASDIAGAAGSVRFLPVP